MEKRINMKNTYFLLGPDDHGRSILKEHYHEGKKLKTYNLEGVTPLISAIVKFKLIDNIIIIDKNLKIEVPKGIAKKLTLFNLISCADSSKNSLAIARQICEKIPFKKVINHPDKIEKTTRGAISQLNHLNDIIMPKSFTVEAKSIQDLHNGISNNLLKFPLIIRIPHFHSGKYMKLFHDASELIDIEDWFVTSKTFNLTEYINVQDDSGYYHKARFAVIEGKVFPRHIIYSKRWCIHSGNRKEDMINNEALKKLEKDFLSGKSSLLKENTLDTLKQVYDELQLDYFGIDCALLPNGKIVIFEANAAMNLFDQEYGKNNEFFYVKPTAQKIEQELLKLLS